MSGIQSALSRYGGMYGAAYVNGTLLADVVEVSGNIEVAKIQVPLVGTTTQGYKAGRESREGNIKIQKVDSYWETNLLTWLQARAASISTNAAGVTSVSRSTYTSPSFDLVLRHDDPDAHSSEVWNLFGCQIWRVPIGFSITDDVIDREFPLTWERETLGTGTGNAATETGAWRGTNARIPTTPPAAA